MEKRKRKPQPPPKVKPSHVVIGADLKEHVKELMEAEGLENFSVVCEDALRLWIEQREKPSR